ncbi:hypothetical protein N7474_010846 [Penicillium riverlandense]|uniref:uncharacterized protein n=1 Tax=Penicillium riverlandense TaxID=1903569 RepID=UPI002547624B|nr:uncharacterized protein N7474_010846 [Penicillium riverlandense]KAJ5804959.1 hypothetical protein N7474_010846 [Penicillium riverlandense]
MSSDIPPFAKPLAPYIHSRQDALRIRQALTSYLRSLVIFVPHAEPSAHHAHSHLSLCAPIDAVAEVKRVPADISGLRKDYLQALQANVAARKEWSSASEEVASRRRRQRTPKIHDEDDLQGPGAELRDYLTLLRDRRRHAKMRVFQHYLDELQAREAVDVDAMGAAVDPSHLPVDAEESGRGGDSTDLDARVHHLERAVVRAKTQLDREKQLFKKIKARHDASNDKPTPAVKVRALQRTRDELVQWVEERLVSEGDPNDSILQELPPEELEEAQRVLEDRKMQIAQQYASYLQARRELLDAAARACQPVNPPAKAPSPSVPKSDLLAEETPPPNPVDVLSYANETLLPLSKSQKALALQKSYLSGLLSKEKSTTLRALNRLRDESHLLPEYPILARQPRFKHAVAALNSRSPPHASPNGETDETVALAEAWAFASEAASASEREYTQQKVALGKEVAQDARKTLAEVYGMLNQDLDEVLREDERTEPEGSDIWASQAQQSSRGRGSGGRAEKRPKGPWTGLNGRVGLE